MMSTKRELCRGGTKKRGMGQVMLPGEDAQRRCLWKRDGSTELRRLRSPSCKDWEKEGETAS